MASGIQIQKLNPRITNSVNKVNQVTGSSANDTTKNVATTSIGNSIYNSAINPVVSTGKGIADGITSLAKGVAKSLAAPIVGTPYTEVQLEDNLNTASDSSNGSNAGVGSSVGASVNPANDINSYQKALSEAISAYQNAGQNRLDALTDNYNLGIGNLQDAYNQRADALRQNNDDALRQAYINYMMGIKNLSQDLSNAGINGGAAESLLANMYNNYGNNRASIQNQTRGNLSDLAASLNESIANLTSGFNDRYADALNDMYSKIAGLKADYFNDEANRNYQLQLANAKANASANGTDTTASGGAKLDNNAYERAMGTLQNMYSGKQYQKMLDYLDNLGVDSTTGNALLADAVNLSPEELYGLLNRASQPLTAENDPLGIIGSGLSIGDIYNYLTNPTINKMAAMRGRN